MSQQLATALQRSGLLNAEQIGAMAASAEATNRSLWEVVVENKQCSEEQVAQALARYMRLPFVKLAMTQITQEVVRAIPEQIARKHVCIAISKNELQKRKTVVVAMSNPSDLAVMQEMEFVTGCAIQTVVATRTEVLDAINREYGADNWLDEFLENVDEGHMRIVSAEDEESVSLRSGNEKTPPVVKLLNLILQQGLREQASDIHLEPTLNHLQVRGRVQGMLKQFMTVPKWLHEPVISRLKVLARMDITDRRRPQDGRVKVGYDNHDIDLRVSTLPTHFGEKAVLRILGSGQRVPSTAALGMSPEELELLKRATDQPQGMILVTGPTGSGKTTTLYSVVNEKKSPTINIVTVEDPVEIQLQGINQVQVNTKAGLTFAASLRSILRQDPDVILVGEIRDLETAEIAINASQTGHLVLSTLHTNSTVATIARLLDIGVDPFLVAGSLNLIVAQRLLRRTCDHCKEIYTPDEKSLERLHLGPTRFTYWRGVGCQHCEGTGFAGRVGVYELLRCNAAIRELISRKGTEAELRKAALEMGMVPLLESAIAKVRSGLTTVEEVLRVIQLDDEDVRRCPQCRAAVDPQFSVCPYCMCALRSTCESCHQEMKPEWKACPYCGAQRRGTVAVKVAVPSVAPAPKTGFLAPTVAEPPTAPLAADEPNEAPQSETPKILVVDDDPVIRGLVCSALTLLPSNPEIHEAEDGIQGVKRALEVRPDVIVTDVNMPNMDGFELCQKLRSRVETAFVPVLMLTVNRDEQNRTRGYLVGTDDYMNKPFSIPEFNARVGRLLRRTYGY
jgi:type IV pilus assembly protein PilB